MNKKSFEWCKNVIYCSLDENQFLGSMEKAIALAKDIHREWRILRIQLFKGMAGYFTVHTRNL